MIKKPKKWMKRNVDRFTDRPLPKTASKRSEPCVTVGIDRESQTDQDIELWQKEKAIAYIEQALRVRKRDQRVKETQTVHDKRVKETQTVFL